MNKADHNFRNLLKAMGALEKSLATPPVEDRDYAGIVQSFKFTYELFWKTLKVILESNGIDAPFPRIVFEEAFKRKMIEGNEIWKDIIEARNQTVHTYDHEFAVDMCKTIQNKFLPIFKKSVEKLRTFLHL